MSKKETTHKLIYDNTFNKSRFNLITTAQKSILFAILTEVQNANDVRSPDGYLFANVTYRRIREITGAKNLASKDIIRMVNELLNTKIEYYMYDSAGDLHIVIENIFNVASINMKTKDVYIELSRKMEQKLAVGNNSFTIVDVRELSLINSHYGQELYRLLSQFKATGKLMIGINQWRHHFDIENKYSDYYIIRKQIIPAVEKNQPYFEDLEVNVKEGDTKLPSTLVFTFKPTKRNEK
mgnify:CR=1 FL=1